MSKRNLRSVAMTSVAAIALLAGTAAAQGASDDVASHTGAPAELAVEFNIAEQALGSALTEFARQSGQHLLFSPTLVEGRTAPALQGEMTPATALSALLAGSGFETRQTRSGAVLITASAASEAGEAEVQPVPETDEGEGEEPDADARGVQGARTEDAAASEPVERDVIVVTGTNIRGVYPASAPVDIYTAEEIALTGATTLERFLETLPQNVNSLSVNAANFGPGEGNGLNGGGIDLRGLGVGTTLVLLNGKRLTSPDGQSPDTSLIPLSAIERVEVLTDGASAIYGSDAIGGVVNFILRDDFEGFSVGATYGGATRGGQDRFQADFAAGTSWGTGSGVVSYAYEAQSDLDVGERDFSSNAPGPQSLIPNEEKHGFLASVDQGLGDRTRVTGSVFYSVRNSEPQSISATRQVSNTQEQEQWFVSTGVEYRIARDIYFQVEATYLDYILERFRDEPARDRQDFRVQGGTAFDFMAKLDGSLISLPAGDLKFSLGGGYFEQEFVSDFVRLPNPIELNARDRESSFGFLELFAPLVQPSQGIEFINRLELNAATRYTEYSDFGGAWTPRVGILWSPVETLNLRTTFARSFRAPTLSELNPDSLFAQIFPLAPLGLPDPFSDDGSSVLFSWPVGLRDDLTPEFADTVTLGFDYEPDLFDGLRISATYYNIDYTDRLGFPAGLQVALFNADEFAFVFNTSPTLDDFREYTDLVTTPSQLRDSTGLITDPSDPEQLFNVATVFYDGRRDNLSQSVSEGFDISVGYDHSTTLGDHSYGLQMTRTLATEQRSSSEAPVIDLLGTVGNTATVKLRGFAGIRRGSLSGRVNLNYVDDFTNPSVDPEESVDSWTTIDLNIQYQFDDHQNSIINGASAFISVNNLFDTDPPLVSQQDFFGLDGLRTPVGYDPVNANPVGRFITVGISKSF